MDHPLWKELSARMGELRDLSQVSGLLTWDQETFMPQGGGGHRAAQLATVQAISHERWVDPRLGELMAWAQGEASLSETQQAMVRNLVREQRRAVRVPGRLIRELAERQALAVEAWRHAKEAGDFHAFAPHLEALLRLRREQADALGHEGERYDPLLDMYEPGMTTARLRPLFAELKQALIPMVQAITEATPPARWRVEDFRYPVERQWHFTLHLLEAMGFDSTRGRQDRSAHPFTCGMGSGDVRLTTRLDETNPWVAIFGTIHEAGHGLYEQNLPAAHARDPIGVAASMGLHESQSRLWENCVGRSLAFWEGQDAVLRRHFPEALEGVGPEQVHAAACRVERSPIRVDADELTYNLHILLRFELEIALLEGDLQVADLPGAWRERMERDLGVLPRGDREGVLQDIHWAWAEFGYFPTYTLGNLYAATLFERLQEELGEGMERALRGGDLLPIRDWLVEHVHSKGHRFDAEEIVRGATGQGLEAAPLLRYLREKYGALYGVRL